jgi:ABC-2 type transport system ATP-binding protein
MIELKSLTKLYGRVIGVNDIDVRLEPGAYGLLGPNGSGKTTLLNLITGQLNPTLGSVRVLGCNPRANAGYFARVGYCPAIDGLYSNVTGHEWVTYLLQLQGWTASAASQKAEEMMGIVGMRPAMHRALGTYSRGMRQRTKLAQALSHDPDLLILDEPFNGLDPMSRHQMTKLLRKWIDRGKYLILASHILHEVESITKSFLLICGGRLLASGSASDVHEILTGIPNDIRIRCERGRELAALIVGIEGVASLKLEENDRLLTVSTHNPRLIYEQLPAWISERELRISELQSADESLQSLFNSLMRIHRGEV